VTPSSQQAESTEAPDALRLVMRGVCKRFGATIALDGVNLRVGRGEVHALVGENGAGKSTLMKVLSGAHPPDEGRMRLDGQPYRPRDPLDGRRAGVSMIYQELSLAGHLSVMENVLLGMEPTVGPFMDWRRMRQRAGAALREVGLEGVPLDRPVRRLSVAQQQLVEIARSVATDCRVLVLDEPTSSLTSEDTCRLFDLIRRLKSRELAIVYISHFLEEVKQVSDTFTVLRDGRTVGGGVTADAQVDRIIAMMVGREVTRLYPRSRRTPGDVVLEVRSLAGQHYPVEATLTLRRGEVLGIAGLVGSGRTELLRAIFGLDVVRSGRIKVRGHFGAATPAERWRVGVGLVCEDRKTEGLATGLSIADNITLANLRGLGPWRWVTPTAQDRASRPWIERIPIKCRSSRQAVNDLSGGNQQKVAIARLLHADVDVLLLDEPTRGIDVGSKAQIYQLIDDLAKGEPERGRPPRAILMVSSYLPELLGVCDRIAVMCRGRLGEARAVDEVDERRIMREATGSGEAA